MKFEFKFEFHRFQPVTGQTGPVYRYRSPAVWSVRSEIKTLVAGGGWLGEGIRSTGARWWLHLQGHVEGRVASVARGEGGWWISVGRRWLDGPDGALNSGTL